MSYQNPTTLVVFLRGWTKKSVFSAAYQKHVLSCFQNAEPMTPDLDMGLISSADPNDLVEQVYRQVDQRLTSDTLPAIDDIVIVSFSAGTVLARALLLQAWGVPQNAKMPDGPAPCSWAGKISRIVLTAGVLRGWEITSVTPKLQRILFPIVDATLSLFKILTGIGFFIMRLRRGSPYIVNTRLRFQALLQALRKQKKPIPSFVYILGAKDEFISPADALDIDFSTASEFVFLEVPQTSHVEMIDISRPHTAVAVSRALTTSHDILRSQSVDPDDLDDYRDPIDECLTPNAQNAAVRDAVIVLHGIRDNGFWTKRIAREVKRRGGRVVLRSPTPSYGYFSIWNFIRPDQREAKTRWFLEQYADVRSVFPNATIHFAGHSNGTYLAANALAQCPALEFGRCFFAGSVVRTDYPWDKRAGQVRDLLNGTAHADFVVACAPGFFEKLPLLRGLNVGGAGFDGFRYTNTKVSEPNDPPMVRNIGPIEGNHNAWIEEDRWGDIANFLSNGQYPSVSPIPQASLGAKIGYVFVLLLFAALFTLIAVSVSSFSTVWCTGEAEAFRDLVGSVALLYLVYKIVRFF